MRLIALYPVGIAVASMMLEVSNAMTNDGKQTNPNGVEFGKPDKQIKCAFFRVINPRTEKYVDFREDVDKGGLDPDLIDTACWPGIYLQQGYKKSLIEGVGLDTQDLEGIVVGMLSHKDLMWSHRAEIAKFLEEKQDENGTISPGDLYEAKKFTSNTFYDTDVTFASYNEVPLVFLKCGGSVETGRVPLKSILEFFDGEPPSTDGRITKDGIDKVHAILKEEGKPKSPSLLTASKDKIGIMKFIYANTLLQKKLKRMVLGE